MTKTVTVTLGHADVVAALTTYASSFTHNMRVTEVRMTMREQRGGPDVVSAVLVLAPTNKEQS